MTLHFTAKNFSEKFLWYPPAETKILWPAILSAFSHQSVNLKAELCSYIGVDNCILGNSARALLFKLLDALNEKSRGHRDEVLIPAYTCYSVAAAVAKAGLKITVYDLNPKTLNADLDSFKNAISEKTLAVVTQHLFGMFTPFDELKRITHSHGAFLIEDAAQALGKVDGQKLPGTLGDFGLFSFGRGKPLPVGGGGALISNDQPHVFDAIQLKSGSNGFKQAALSTATQFVSKPYLYWIPEKLPLGLGETVFDPCFEADGLPNALETMAMMSLPTLDRLNLHRREISDIYSKMIDPKHQVINSDEATSIIRFPVMLPNASLTKEIKRLGVRRMYPCAILNESTIRPYLNGSPSPTPGAEEIASKLFTLPTHLGINKSLAMEISHILTRQ